MTVLSWEAFTQSENIHRGPLAMTIGVFDGVHRGHRALIKRVLDRPETEPWILTFRSNPILSLKPGAHRGDLMSLDDKLAEFARLGLRGTVIIDFSADFRRLRGEEFLSRLSSSAALGYLAVGKDFHCGYGMDTDAEKTRSFLEKDGVPVDIVPPVFYQGERISSTRIRDYILAGDFSPVREMLGRPYRLDLSGEPDGRAGNPRSLEKKALSQVLPRRGRFPVLFEGPDGKGKKGAVDIDEKIISWHYDGQVKAIIFVA